MQAKIIEYVEHGKFICAAIMADAGSRVHLLNQNGREVNLPKVRIVHQAPGPFTETTPRDQILQILLETAAFRQTIQLPTTLQEVWEIVNEEEGESFSPQFLTELCFGGKANDDQVAAFLRAIFQEKLFFKYRGDAIQAHSQETVEQLRLQKEREARQEAILKQGAQAIQNIMAGEIPGDWPQQECIETLRAYYLFGNEAPDFTLARELIQEAGLSHPHDIFHLLVALGVWQPDENIPLLRAQLPIEFSEESKTQAKSIIANSDLLLDAEGRIDLRHLSILTVDGASTRDFDDALHVEAKGDNFEIGIHISDVSQFVVPKTPLFQDAKQRTTSLYFPDATVPMLPTNLSEGALSLIKGNDRAALSFLVTLSPQGEILTSSIRRSLVNVKRQLSYAEAASLYGKDQELTHLTDLADKLKERRIEDGALLIPIPDVVFRITNGQVNSIELHDVDTPMRSMVSEFMVLANTLAAKFLCYKEEPGLYRSQDPSRKRFFKQPEHDLFINFRQRRFLSRGHLTTTPKRHDGVGVDQYTTTTSPIRRFLDLIIQHQITSILKCEGQKFSTSKLNEYATIISAAQSRLNLIRQQRHRYWLFKFLEQRKGQSFAAFVLDKRNQKIQVVLKDFLFEGELPFSPSIRPELGDVVQVRVAEVSAVDNSIRLEW